MDVIDVIYDIQKQQAEDRIKSSRANDVMKFIDFNCTEDKSYPIKELYDLYITLTYDDIAYTWFVEIINRSYEIAVEYGRKHLIGGSKKDVDYIAIGRLHP